MPPLYNRRPDPGLTPQPPAPLALAELLRRVREALSGTFPDAYWVVAEIAELTLPRFGSGHCYLTLTDQAQTGRGAQLKAQARATIWAARYEQLAPQFELLTGQTLRAGLRVLLRVSIKFHEQYGLSLDVLAIDPTYTVGDLARQRLETVRKLEAKGLLTRQQSLPLALAPQRLAVISSPTAAGFQDFMRQLDETVYAFEVTLFAATMQGSESPASLLGALEQIRRQQRHFDAVVIIRGGGSKTDLLAFDDYGVSAAVGAFPLPVLTGIGHERDEAVVDLTAHMALKTPTAVAVFLTERLGRLDAVFDGYASRIRELANEQLTDRQRQLLQLGNQLRQAAKSRYQTQHLDLQQHARQLTNAARTVVTAQQRATTTRRHHLQRAAHLASQRQQRRLRRLGRALAQRFRRQHRRRHDALVRLRFQLELQTRLQTSAANTLQLLAAERLRLLTALLPRR